MCTNLSCLSHQLDLWGRSLVRHSSMSRHIPIYRVSILLHPSKNNTKSQLSNAFSIITFQPNQFELINENKSLCALQQQIIVRLRFNQTNLCQHLLCTQDAVNAIDIVLFFSFFYTRFNQWQILILIFLCFVAFSLVFDWVRLNNWRLDKNFCRYFLLTQ